MGGRFNEERMDDGIHLSIYIFLFSVATLLVDFFLSVAHHDLVLAQVMSCSLSLFFCSWSFVRGGPGSVLFKKKKVSTGRH
jgi:hypothetical protein